MRRVGEVFLAPTAFLSGEVAVGRGVSLWPGASVRGDVAPVSLGDLVNVQDCAVVHCDYGVPNDVEEGVVIGHSAVVHGRRVGRDTLVGIGAKLLGETVVGEECIIAAGAVLPPGMVVPPRSVVMGMPGRVVRPVRPDELARTRAIRDRYRQLAQDYAEGRVPFPFGAPAGGQS